MDASELYFDELIVGQRTISEAISIDAESIKIFARQFDPQYFHIDEEAAKASLFKGLVASGWHTAALTMSLIVKTTPHLAKDTIGMGSEISWLQPVRPGDTLHIENEILELRESQKNPNSGIATIRTKTINQKKETVQILIAKVLVPKRSRL